MSDCLQSKKVLLSKTLKKLPTPAMTEYLICEMNQQTVKKNLYTNEISFSPILDIDQGGTYPIVASLYSFPEKEEDKELKTISFFIEISPKSLSNDPNGKYTIKRMVLDQNIYDKKINTNLTNMYIRVIAQCELNYNRIIRIAFKYKIDKVRLDWSNVRKSLVFNKKNTESD